jgi:hypothetical protein
MVNGPQWSAVKNLTTDHAENTDLWFQIPAFVRVGPCLSVVIFEFGIDNAGQALANAGQTAGISSRNAGNASWNADNPSQIAGISS